MFPSKDWRISDVEEDNFAANDDQKAAKIERADIWQTARECSERLRTTKRLSTVYCIAEVFPFLSGKTKLLQASYDQANGAFTCKLFAIHCFLPLFSNEQR